MSNLEKTLKERKDVYGKYSDLCNLREIIMNAIKSQYRISNKSEMHESDFLRIIDVVNKLCRIATTPNHIDTWHDIAGYATIIEKLYKEKEDADK